MQTKEQCQEKIRATNWDETERKYRFTCDSHTYVIPDYMRNGIDLYIDHGITPGDFLTAVICNDLVGAVGRADSTNIHNLPAYANFFYNYAPSPCWGSKAKMDAWVKTFQDKEEK